MAETSLLERVRGRLIADGGGATAPRVASALRAEGVVLADDAVLQLVQSLRDELLGAGPLEPLLRIPEVTDILVNGPEEVWTDRGAGLVREPIRFPGEREVLRLAQRLAAMCGRRLDEASPWVDARLADGTRVHAVIPPIAMDGTVLSLRIPRRRTFSLHELIEAGSTDAAGAQWLERIVDAGPSFLISGGTGSGKTTLLAALLSALDPQARIVLVEDSAELLLAHPHVVRLQSRPANIEGAGEVTLRDLVRQALRMRPDRLVVGEVRGAEVVDLLAALNTGHEGGCGTIHANSAADVPARLEALGLMAGLDRQAIGALVCAGLEVLIHLDRRGGTRRIGEISMLGSDGTVHPALTWHEGCIKHGPGLAALERRLA